MASIYDLMNSSAANNKFVENRDDGFDVRAWSEKRKKEREEAFARIDEAALRVNSDSKELNNYLDVASVLPFHSTSNVLLIYYQRPTATRVGDSNYWAKQGASIKRGERGIAVLEPAKEFTRDDGSIGILYDVKKVFDVSQTTARTRLPRRSDTHEVLAAIITKSPCALVPVDDLKGELAVYDPKTQSIQVQKGLSETQLFWAITAEAAHANMAQGDPNYNREANVNKAELAANIVAKRLGLEVSPNELPAPAAKDASPRDIRDALTQVGQAAKDITGRALDAMKKTKEREHDAR